MVRSDYIKPGVGRMRSLCDYHVQINNVLAAQKIPLLSCFHIEHPTEAPICTPFSLRVLFIYSVFAYQRTFLYVLSLQHWTYVGW